MVDPTDGSWLSVKNSPVFDLILIPLLFINPFDDPIDGWPVLRIRDV
jgi:hypothetical protein